MKQPIAPVNIDGAAGSIALTRLANANPDVYTIGTTPAVSLTSEPHRNKGVTYNLESFRYACQVFDNVFASALFTCGITAVAINSIERRDSAGSAQSRPAYTSSPKPPVSS